MKRKYTDRTYLKRVVERRFKSSFIDDGEFRGYLSLFKINKLTHACDIGYRDKKVCVLDNGYTLLQYVPLNENYTLTVFINENNEIIQWYFDISYENGLGSNGIPYYDDLYLDIVVLSSLEVYLLDEDELEEALQNSLITREQYNLAYEVANDLLIKIEDKNMPLMYRWERDLDYMKGKT